MILIGQAATLLTEQCVGRRVVLIADQNIKKLYPALIEPYAHVEFDATEQNKTIEAAQNLCRELLALGADRSTLIVGVGGGITTDVAGFVASTYMRGIDFGFVATTLLAQVDAAIGGKNGVNLDGYKNMIGTFSLPRFVVADPEMLETLPPRELRSAMGEVIKYGLIADPEILRSSDMSNIIGRSMAIKERIVTEDFRETGARKLLNFGHTYGHAVEKATAGKYHHGEAVGIGMAIACRISLDKGLLSQADYSQIIGYIRAAGLPVECPEVSMAELTKLIVSDKKRKGNTLQMILLRGIGQPVMYDINLSEALIPNS